MKQIDMQLIQPGNNDRTQFKLADLETLAASIQENGLIQPITVRPVNGKFEIVAGERRYRACQSLGWATIPAIVKEMDDQTASKIMLLENLQREDIDPIDQAWAFKSRIDRFGLSIAQMAQWAGVSESTVRSRLALLDLMPDIQHLIRHGNMPLSYAAAMAGLQKNFQMVAMRYFGQAKRPTITEFRQMCSGLLEDQNQCAMWDMDQFMARPIQEIVEEKVTPVSVHRFQLWGISITIEYQTPRWISRLKGML